MMELGKLHVSLPFAFTWMLRLLTLFGVVSLGIVIYAMYFEDPFIRYQNLPFPIASPTVEQGRSVPIIIERCNDTSVDRVYISSRSLKSIDTGKEVSLPESTVSLKSGCQRIVGHTVVIPLDTIPGKYMVQGEAITQGLLKKHYVNWYTEQFRVIPIKPLTRELNKENAAETNTP